MIGPASRPRLAPKVRFRFDKRSGKHMLLYPERGLELTAQAARIAELCAEQLTVAAMVERLVSEHPGVPHARIEADVLTFLRQLDDRGLLAETGT